MPKKRPARARSRRGRLSQPRVTRAEFNRLVRRLDTMERHVSDLRAIAVSWIRQVAPRAGTATLLELPPLTDGMVAEDAGGSAEAPASRQASE